MSINTNVWGCKKYTHDELNKDENFNEKIQVLTGGHLNTPFGSPTRGEQNTKKSHAPGKEMLVMQVTRKMPSRGRPSNVRILC